MSREKRSYTRIAPLSWSVSKGASLWRKGILIREIAKELKISEGAVKQAAVRYGWPPRVRRQLKDDVTSKTLTRRCPDCLGHYEGGDSVHTGCRMVAA